MATVIKLHSWVKTELERDGQEAIVAKLLNHYHRLRLHEAEVLSKKVKCRECPYRH